MGAVSVGRAGLTRQIINVAGGTQDTDAVNVAQVRPLVAALNGSGIKYFHASSADPDAVATGTNTVAIGSNSNASGSASLAAGNAAAASGSNAVAIGNAAIATGVGGVGAVNDGVEVNFKLHVQSFLHTCQL